MGAGLVALVVFADPSFTRLAWADALAVAVAAASIAAALAPIQWDRLPRLTIAGPLVVALLLALGATFAQGSAVSLAAGAAGVLVIVGIYGVRWDGLPRWVHELPVFGGLAAVFVIQATVHAPGYAVAPVLLVFPLYLTTVLFAALYHTRNEVLARGDAGAACAAGFWDGDKRQLNGHAKAILERGSTGATDILAWLDRLMGHVAGNVKQR